MYKACIFRLTKCETIWENQIGKIKAYNVKLGVKKYKYRRGKYI